MINRTPGKVFEGELNAKGLRIGIVCSRFNEFFVGKLLAVLFRQAPLKILI